MHVRRATGGRCCEFGLLTFAEREAGAAPVLQVAPLVGRAALDAAAARRDAAALDLNGDGALPPFRDATIESGAAVGPHSALDVMSCIQHQTICDPRVIRASGKH